MQFRLPEEKDEEALKAYVQEHYDNAASGATIRKCGGILIAENCGYEPDKVSQYYAIEV